jgi:hypothetical protein
MPSEVSDSKASFPVSNSERDANSGASRSPFLYHSLKSIDVPSINSTSRSFGVCSVDAAI